MTETPYSGVILAGGENKRFNGRNKAMMEVGGQRIMDRLMSVLSPIFKEIIVVTKDPLQYLEWDAVIVSDHFDQSCSLNGIHAGLAAASCSHALVTACDPPSK